MIVSTKILPLVLVPLFVGTTFIIKEGGREVGRFEEQDGKSGIKFVENDKAKAVPPGKISPPKEETDAQLAEKFLEKIHALDQLDSKITELQALAGKVEIAQDVHCLSYEGATLVDRCEDDLRLASSDMTEFLDSFNEPERLRAGFADLVVPAFLSGPYRKVLSGLRILTEAKGDLRSGNVHEGKKKLKEYRQMIENLNDTIPKSYPKSRDSAGR